MTDQKHHYAFIHNAFGKFIESTQDYFVSQMFPRFKWSVLGTFDKAVEYINKQNQQSKGEPFDPPDKGPSPEQPELPALIINPMGDISLDEARHGGQQLYRFPNRAPGLLPYLYNPIYKDENVLIVPGFTRFKGELECIALLNSFYEYFDFRVLLLQMFGGLERNIYPVFFETFLIIDDKLLSYTYKNDVLNVEYQLDWLSNGAHEHLVPTTNRNEVVFPCRIRPLFRLTSQSDNSERYGGPDKLAEYKLGFTITYEIEIPTSMVIFENLDVSESERHMTLNISFGSSTSEYLLKDEYYTSLYKEDVKDYETRPIFPSLKQTLIDRTQEDIEKLAGFEFDENNNIVKDVHYPQTSIISYESTINSDGEVTNVDEYNITLLARYYHKLTTEQLDQDILDINLPIKIQDLNYIDVGGFKVNSKLGEMVYKKHFDVIADVEEYDTLRIFMEDINVLVEDDLIEIFYYRVEGGN